MIKSANFLLITIFILQSIIGLIFNSGNFSYLFNIVVSQVFAILIPLILFISLNKRKTYLKQGYFKKVHIIIAILCTLAINILSQYINIPVISFMSDLNATMPIDYVPNGIFEFVAYFILIAFVPAILEEFLFRKIVLDEYRGVYGDFNAIILCGLSFALLHMNPASFVPQFIIGMFLSYLAVKTDGILLPIICHFIQNASLVIIRKFLYDEVVYALENNIVVNVIISIIILTAGIFIIGKSIKTKPKARKVYVENKITTALYFVFVSIVLGFNIILN